jgi:hypothetical protein
MNNQVEHGVLTVCIGTHANAEIPAP